MVFSSQVTQCLYIGCKCPYKRFLSNLPRPITLKFTAGLFLISLLVGRGRRSRTDAGPDRYRCRSNDRREGTDRDGRDSLIGGRKAKPYIHLPLSIEHTGGYPSTLGAHIYLLIGA